jgi:hypothetical protein
MAQIQIPGIPGAIEIPDFATEYTLNQLLAAISSQEASQIGKLGDIAQGLDSEASVLRSSLSEMQETSANTGASRRSQDQANKNTLLSLQHMKKQHKEVLKASSKTTSMLPRHTAQILRTAASMVGGKGIGDALSMMPGNLGQGIALATKVIGEFSDSQRRLTDVGMGLGTSIMNTTQAIADFNLPLSEIERVAGTHAVTLNWLNESTKENYDTMEKWTKQGVKPGIVAFADLSKTVRDSMKHVGNYGFTVTEVNSYLAEYLESDRKRGITADVSTANLQMNFHSLADEVSAYASDTGRNRKDLMKAQLDNMNRTDASTYSMMLRMKGEDAAAETFENNLQLITNEMKSRYGDNADAMIDTWIQAQAQGRGLEATAEGAEFMAMLGPAGAVFDRMARSGEAIDPATFKLFDDKLKESVGAYDTHNLALLAKQKESLNMAANMIMYGRDTSEASRKLWSDEIKRKTKEGTVGADLLKANEAMVTVTTDLQAGLLAVTQTLVGKDGNFSSSLDKALNSVTQFSDAIKSFAEGKPGEAGKKILDMLADNPFQFLLAGLGLTLPALLAAAGATVAGAISGTWSDPVSHKNQGTVAKSIAGQNVAGHFTAGAGQAVDTAGKVYKDGSKVVVKGVEYIITNGKPVVTPAGLAAITGGIGSKAFTGLKGGGAGGLFTLAMAAMQGFSAHSDEKDRFKEQTAGMDKGSPEYKKAKEESEKVLSQIIKNTLAKGGGGVLGGMALGAAMGSLTTNPILMAIAMGAGTYLGWQAGDEVTKVDGTEYSNFANTLQQKSEATKSLSSEGIKTKYAEDARNASLMKQPEYIKLKQILDALNLQQETLDAIAGASSLTAVTVHKSSGKNNPATHMGHT